MDRSIDGWMMDAWMCAQMHGCRHAGTCFVHRHACMHAYSMHSCVSKTDMHVRVSRMYIYVVLPASETSFKMLRKVGQWRDPWDATYAQEDNDVKLEQDEVFCSERVQLPIKASVARSAVAKVNQWAVKQEGAMKAIPQWRSSNNLHRATGRRAWRHFLECN